MFYTRTQNYVRGVIGTVAARTYQDLIPEDEAFNYDGRQEQYYIVRFRQKDLWEEYPFDNDTLQTEFPDRWLEPARNLIEMQNTERTPMSKGHKQSRTGGGHEHDGHHHHGNGNGNVHEHKAAPMVDEITDYEVLEIAVRELAIEHGLFTAEDHRKFTEWAEAVGPAAGSRLVAKAWADPAFKARVLEDATKACKEIGIDWVEPTGLARLATTRIFGCSKIPRRCIM